MYKDFLIDIKKEAVDRYAHFLWLNHNIFRRRFKSETEFKQEYREKLKKRLEEQLRAGSFGDVILEGKNSLSGKDEVFTLTEKEWSLRLAEGGKYEQLELFH